MGYAQLKAFHAVAQSGGFSKAAARLSLTQPAISDHIGKLEQSCGAQLFKRTRREAILTDVGRKLFALTERLFEAEREADELLSRARILEEGSLAIGADAAIHVLPLLKRFRERYPKIAARVVSGNSAQLLARLARFEIDFAVVAVRPADNRYCSLLLREAPLVALVGCSHPLAKARRVAFRSLIDHIVILREEGSVTRSLFLEEAARRNLFPPSVLEVETREGTIEAVAQGLGLAIVSEGELAPDPRLRKLAFADWSAIMQEWLVWLEPRSGLQLLQAFLEIARNG